MRYVLIPARKGSQGVPNKNLRPLGPQSLVERAVDVALALTADVIEISTDYEIWDLPESCQPYHLRRPVKYCEADTSMSDVLIHWAATHILTDEDTVILLQPTSLHPKRAEKVLSALSHPTRPIIAVEPIPTKYHPFYALIPHAIVNHPMPTCRQDLPPRYVANGLFYILSGMGAKNGYIWKPRPTYLVCQHVLNINDPDDWTLAEKVYGRS